MNHPYKFRLDEFAVAEFKHEYEWVRTEEHDWPIMNLHRKKNNMVFSSLVGTTRPYCKFCPYCSIFEYFENVACSSFLVRILDNLAHSFIFKINEFLVFIDRKGSRNGPTVLI